MDKNSEHLAARFGHTLFRHALLFGVIQTTTAGLCQSAQAGFEAALRAMPGTGTIKRRPRLRTARPETQGLDAEQWL